MNRPALWEKYGLDIPEGVWFQHTDAENRAAVQAHWLVANYLESHPETAARWKNDQTGELRYFDVLRLAEREHEPEVSPCQ